MFRRGLEIVSLVGLWAGNVMIIISLMNDSFVLGLFGISIGSILGLPTAYLWFLSDKPLFKRFSKHLPIILSRRPKTIPHIPKARSVGLPAPAVKPIVHVPITDGNVIIKEQRIIEPPKKVATAPLPAPAVKPIVHVPITDGDVIIKEQRIISAPEPVRVPIEIEAPLVTETPILIENVAVKAPPQPTEWEQKMQQDAAYEEAKTTLAALADDNYPEIAPYLEHADARVRLAVVQKLRRVSTQESTTLLNQALQDTDTVVQRAVRIALEERQKS